MLFRFLPRFFCTNFLRRAFDTHTIGPLLALNICAVSGALVNILTWLKLTSTSVEFPHLASDLSQHELILWIISQIVLSSSDSVIKSFLIYQKSDNFLRKHHLVTLEAGYGLNGLYIDHPPCLLLRSSILLEKN